MNADVGLRAVDERGCNGIDTMGRRADKSQC
jgi:hypothetical protein